MGLLLLAFLAQTVVIAIIIVVLKKILDHMLIDLSICHFDYYRPEQQSQQTITIITHKKVSSKYKIRIEKAARRHSVDTARLQYQIDRRILGGMIIKIDGKVIDYSLKDRLCQALPWVSRHP